MKKTLSENEMGLIGKNDRPCVVWCYGKREEWKSRNRAIRFFRRGAAVCDGCEAERYGTIVDYLLVGCDEVCDDADNPTPNMIDVMVAEMPEMKEFYDYEAAKKRYAV